MTAPPRPLAGTLPYGDRTFLGARTLAFRLAHGTTRLPADDMPVPPAEKGGKLVVLIVVDQLRGDLLTRYEKLFGDRGFRRLAREGPWFQDCRYPYASTFTAAGHASLVTGCSPDRHGIIANDWYDRAAGYVSAVRSLDERNVPYFPPGGNKRPASGSPRPAG